MEFLPALAASVAERAGSQSCGSAGWGTTFLNKQRGMCLTQFSGHGEIPVISLNRKPL